MARANIHSIYNKAIRDIQILSSYVQQSSNLEPKYQYIVSEVVMLRLFSILERYPCEQLHPIKPGNKLL